jgi:hypothetical protein
MNLKLLMLWGGVLGFLIGIGGGLARGHPVPVVLLQGCVATYLGGRLFRWWGRLWLKGLVQSSAPETGETKR